MLYDELENPDELTPGELRDRYEAELDDVITTVGADRVSQATGIDPEAVTTIGTGDAADLDLRDAAAILSLADDAPGTDAILREVRDRLLLQMSSAMLDVDTVARELDLDLSPNEVQGKIEGRLPMTLGEYALLHQFIASEANW